MGATTYRLMSGFASRCPTSGLSGLTAHAQGRVLLDLGGTAVLGQHRAGRP